MMAAVPYTVLVVDDEPLARQRIRQLMHKATDFDIVAECDDGSQVESIVRAVHPNVVFLDIRMTQMDGFTALAAIKELVRHVVFVSAYPQHAARAFDVDAVDYLVKPVTQGRFAAALDKLRRACGSDETPRVLLSGLRGAVSVAVPDIDWIAADGAYVVVHIGTERHVLRESLGGMLARLGSTRFARIHRSAGVNLDHVRGIRRTRNHMEIELVNGTRLPVSRRRAGILMDRLDTARAPLRTKSDR